MLSPSTSPSPSPSFFLSVAPADSPALSSPILFPPPVFSWPHSLSDGPFLRSPSFPTSPPPLSPHPRFHPSPSSPSSYQLPPLLPSFTLPAAVKVEALSLTQGRSSPQHYSPPQPISPALSSSLSTLTSSPRSNDSGGSHDSQGQEPAYGSYGSRGVYEGRLPSLPLSSASSSSASSPSPDGGYAVSSYVLSFLRLHFDTHRRLQSGEEVQWEFLLSSSPQAYSRAQSEAAVLHAHFDEILHRLAAVYERQSQWGDAADEELSPALKAEALDAIRAIADKFVTARKAVLHLHLVTAKSTHAPVKSGRADSGGKVARVRKPKRVVPLPANSTSSKRAYFAAQSTAVLKRWFAASYDDPYPSSEVKATLAEESGLSYDQVQHWFINARMRKWRPALRKTKEAEDKQRQRQTAVDTAVQAPSPPAAEDEPSAANQDSDGETTRREEAKEARRQRRLRRAKTARKKVEVEQGEE